MQITIEKFCMISGTNIYTKNDSIATNFTKWTNLKIQGFFQVAQKNLVFQGIPGLEQKIPKFKKFQVFQVAYEPCYTSPVEEKKK